MDKKEIENTLKDYHWMLNSIKIMRKSMEQAGDNLTAQYGIEAVMPKGKGQTGDPVYREVIRRSKHHERIEGYEKKVELIQSNIHVISDEREIEILHWLLEGKGHAWISRHMGLSHTHINRISKSIASKIAKNVQYVQNVQDVQKVQSCS
ncbi:hypothetical protein BEP19_09895 [Ammoniphilus oxalaticus]|uniref:HTH luxR-type domain-containing protein n=1 Tax=Ammoniphilus oxalaticus TaxID=66863 RepID=A0A419SFJ7_9BACL|nr:DNA-binding response regulator [Ammoniphilus oxalaticus]RKD22563.1 hypothetical protein BEP19_09895 [Ammoniphilus oxalaticus]